MTAGFIIGASFAEADTRGTKLEIAHGMGGPLLVRYPKPVKC